VGSKSKPEITTQFLCPNKKCPGILKEKLKHFVSKNCMNIASVGDAIIELLVDQHILTSIDDIYTLMQSDNVFVLKKLPGIGDKKIDTFVDEINKSKINQFRRLLNGLGISGIGIKLAKEISSTLERCGYGDIKDLDALFIIINNAEFISSIY
jgi:DNA ligase (NAD+)